MKTEQTTYNLLNAIDYPEDLRRLRVEQLPEVCKELGIELNGRFIIVDKYNHYEMYRAKSFGLLFCNTFLLLFII